MAATVNRLTNANIYVDGVNYLGRAEEVTLPDLKAKMAEHKALGMAGSFELPSGFDKMEAKIKWNAFYPDALRKFGSVFSAIDIQVRGNLETWAGGNRAAQAPVVIFLVGTPKNFPAGNFKQHDNVELESMINVTYLRVEIDGSPVMEIDVMANIYKVDGEDQLGIYRANIGG